MTGPAVIGAGWGRTGTTSLQKALEILGFGPCHHMHEVMAHREQVPFFQAAVDGESVDWNTLFTSYGSAVDWPVAAFWQELAELYPESKVILTVREPTSWWRSFSRTILAGIQTPKETIDDPDYLAMSHMVDKLIIERVFGCAPDDKTAVLAKMHEHAAEVQQALPPDRLLTMAIDEGWQPLCDFLGCAVPNEPYPALNKTKDFEKNNLR